MNNFDSMISVSDYDEMLSFRDILETKASVNFETEQNQIEVDDIRTKQILKEEELTAKAKRRATLSAGNFYTIKVGAPVEDEDDECEIFQDFSDSSDEESQ